MSEHPTPLTDKEIARIIVAITNREIVGGVAGVRRSILTALAEDGFIVVAPGHIQLPRNREEAGAMYTAAEAILMDRPSPLVSPEGER